MWFDSHCHLQICEEEESVDRLIERARVAGVLEMLSAGTDIASSRRCIEISQEAGLYAAVGVHPNSSSTWNEEARATLESLVQSDGVVAVGESGLDFYRDAVPADVQLVAFLDHIELAKRFGKALIIHTRDSVDRALDELERAGPPERLVFHCWSGDASQLTRALDLGAFVSFAGNVSFKKAEDLRAAAVAVPDDRLLIETDSPYLAPEPHRGERNEPRNVAFVGLAIARARDVSSHMLADRTTQNARALFGITTR